MNPLYRSDVLKALEQIRPYIKADGGDVELVDIADNGIVSVRLTGNCVGCASAGVPCLRAFNRPFRVSLRG